ncbi:hypothetical protein CAPTEDRAFT_226501 [Capitella teleta]|uniref:Uncharacterized protein n=1 Tax=Capitella teleta TaxID=283909 RepID=R7TCI6_CAPTE|nr:hypothetical protein CAPTEDRAFT_226501 [Capitella teleta]|eukprot:ELT91227.1 hypothetical protein CAPTEDRAFT_226501 [Capitella teleta]
MESLLTYASSSDDEASARPSASASKSTKNYLFNLSDSDAEDNESVPSAKDEVVAPQQEKIVGRSGETIEIPATDFWKNSSEILQRISPSDTGTRKRDKSETPQTSEWHERKKSRISHPPADQLSTQTETRNQPLEHSCFFLHHRVEFLLSKSKPSQAPTRVSKLGCHTKCVNQVAWCQPQFSHLLLSCSMDGCVKIWDAFSCGQRPIQVLSRGSKGVKQAVWSRDGKQVLCGSYDKVAVLYDVQSGCEVIQCAHEDYVTAVKFHPMQDHLFVTGGCNLLHCWDVRMINKPYKKFVYKDAFGQVQDICFNIDGLEFFTCNDQVCRDSSDRNIMAWDFEKGVVVSNQIYQERFTCTRLKCHPSGKQFAAQTQGNYIAVFSTQQPYKMNRNKRYDGHFVSGYSIGCDFSPDGRFLISGSSDGKLCVFDYKTGNIFRKIQISGGKDAVCMDVAWHPLLPSLVAACTWQGGIAICQ